MFKDVKEAVTYLENKGYKVKLYLKGAYDPDSKYCKACLDRMDSFSLKCKSCVHI